MNYKRGMLRIYLVLSALWIGVAVVVSVIERPYTAAPWKNDPVVSSTNSPRKSGVKQPHVWDEKGNPIYLNDNGNPIRLPPGATVVPSPKTDQWEELARERSAHPSAASEPVESIIRYWAIRSAWAFTPPVVGYLILFGVLPWIGRGFRSTHL